MKKGLLFIFLIHFGLIAQVQQVNFLVAPETFEEDEQITITVSNINPSLWGVSDIYLWAWSYDLNGANSMDAPNNGTWTDSKEEHKLTNNANGTYSISFVPKDFYNRTGIGSIGFLVKAKNGNGDKKSQDAVYTIGSVDKPPVTEAPVPAGMLDGLNLDPNDPGRATFVLFAPGKEFVYLVGSFNNWSTESAYLLKKDSSKDRFWIELTGLSPGIHQYQYLIDGSMRVADPYSMGILDEFNDQYIDDLTYPNLPAYPTGSTSHAVSFFDTAKDDYNWKITDFKSPEKTDLVIYEILLRDFDALHSFQALEARLDYLEELGVNAIELMPVSEFDGNESWGYNPSFHMALDKYYGTPEALKELVDACHERGMAVILDVVYNHATGQHPYYRMWNTSNGGYGGQASSENPFFNPVATHSYSVFNDFDHSSVATRDYVKRTLDFWIEEYQIDGFRWDLTKGFTQNCTGSESCTNAYQADRVAVLKEYADTQWNVDPDFLIIFEHLGTNAEETEWVNYRLNEGKGIMVWGNHNHPYNESTMGYHESGKSDFSWISYKERGWEVPANVSYMESHDEERLMYKNLQYGNSNSGYSVKDLSTALERQGLAGAFYFTVPGPKMIWQFGELGYDYSINYCENGTVDPDCRTGKKPFRWDYFDDPERKAVYELWKKLIRLRSREGIFHSKEFRLDVGGASGLKKIQIDNDNSEDPLKYITIIGNFGVEAQQIDPDFQQAGIWYDLLDENKEFTVSNVNQLIDLAPGEFYIFGTDQVSLSVGENILDSNLFQIYPNPATESIRVNKPVEELIIYDHTGRRVASLQGGMHAQEEFDVSWLSPSLYFVQIVADQRRESVRLLIQ